jgi:hypothetical protein
MQIILSWIAEALVTALFELLVGMLGHAIARITLPPMSFGWIEVEPLHAPPARFNWLGYRRKDRHVEIAATSAGLIGLLIGLFGCLAVVVLIRMAA